MDINTIKELLKAFDDSDASFLALESEDMKIKLKKPSETVSIVNPNLVPMTNQQPLGVPDKIPDKRVETVTKTNEPEDGEKVLAPLVGVFYAAPTPEESAYVQVGDKVKKGQVLCLIEAMKMMSEITSPADGIVKKIYVKNQDVVGFEDPLFLIGD